MHWGARWWQLRYRSWQSEAMACRPHSAAAATSSALRGISLDDVHRYIRHAIVCMTRDPHDSCAYEFTDARVATELGRSERVELGRSGVWVSFAPIVREDRCREGEVGASSPCAVRLVAWSVANYGLLLPLTAARDSCGDGRSSAGGRFPAITQGASSLLVRVQSVCHS